MIRASRLVFAAAALLAGCKVSGVQGTCSENGNCAAGSICDTSQSPPVCVVPQGACFPACASGFTCVSGACVSSVCTPACDADHVCDPATVTCKDVTVPTVAVTSPASGFIGLAVQATATARAPGGVNGVRFEVRSLSGTVLASSATVQATTPGSANFAATITLNGTPTPPDGAANLVAVMTYPAGTLASAPIGVTIDLTAPAISNTYDGTGTWLGPAHPSASVVATVTDAGAGVDPTTVKLTLTPVGGGAAKVYTGVAGSANQYTFTIPLADTGVGPGAQGTASFVIDAKDRVGNAAAHFGASGDVVKVDLIQPTAAVTADATWYAASAVVTVHGTASDAHSGLPASGVVLTNGSYTSAPGTIAPAGTAASTFTVSDDLSQQTIAAGFEGTVPFTVTVTDVAGNAQAVPGHVNVDNAGPTITAISVTTTPDCAALTCGHDYYKGGAGNLTVTATIADAGAGVKLSATTPCLVVGTTTTCPNARTSGNAASGVYTFTLPRSAASSTDDATPIHYTITADDILSTGTGVHHTTSSQQDVYLDAVAPAITKVADGTWYARKAGVSDVLVTVHATVVEAGSGLQSATLTVVDANAVGPGSVHNMPGTCTGSDCTFVLDAAYLAAGTEGALSFLLTAADRVGNATTAVSDSRNVDDKAPTVSNVEIYAAGAADPGANGVTYPAALVSTGYASGQDGSHFLYNQELHLKGTIADGGAGVFANALLVRIDGATAGTTLPLTGTGCTTGSKSCAFDVTTTALNDLTKMGRFDAASGNLSVVLLAEDAAVAGDGLTADHNVMAPQSTSVAVTRYWWRRQIINNTVSGVALHPDGDVIYTTLGGTSLDTVFAMYPDGPFHASSGEHWHFGAGLYGAASDLGAVAGAPAVGAGDASTAQIYIASSGGDLVDISPAGSAVWKCGNGAFGAFTTSPTIAPLAKLGNAQSCEGVVAGSTDMSINAACPSALTPGACTSKGAVLNDKIHSATTIQGGKFYVGTDSSVAQIAVNGTGSGFTSATYFPATGTNGPFVGIAASGPALFAFGNGAQGAYSFDTAMAQRWALATAKTTKAEPVLDSTSGNVLVETSDKKLHSIDPTSGTDSTPATLASTGYTPLLASDGRAYVGFDNSTVSALDEANAFAAQWTFNVGAAATTPLAMDCNGTLYVGAGDKLYALITDAQGLRNGTPWPKYQRDSRNSGNADATTLWGVRTGLGCTQ